MILVCQGSSRLGHALHWPFQGLHTCCSSRKTRVTTRIIKNKEKTKQTWNDTPPCMARGQVILLAVLLHVTRNAVPGSCAKLPLWY